VPYTPDAALKALKKNQFAPLYLLHGDEPYYLDQLAEYLEANALPAAARDFNQFVLFGKDLNIGGLLSYAKRFPMLSDRQLVLVKEAQDLAGLEAKDTSRFLEEYARNPLASTVLVLVFKQPVDERKAWVKAFDQQGVLVQSKKLYESKVPDWIAEYCHARGIKISPKAMQLLAESVGTDLKRLANELDKILLNLTLRDEIDAEVVERFVGISREYNNFELQKALLQRDVLKANRIVQFFAANPKDNPLPPTLLVLYNFFSKLLLVHTADDRSEKVLAAQLGVNPYFVKDYLAGIRAFPLAKVVRIVQALRRADAQGKGVEGGELDERAILAELVYQILH
jgi:DNA polymerase-3 subunit delta